MILTLLFVGSNFLSVDFTIKITMSIINRRVIHEIGLICGIKALILKS